MESTFSDVWYEKFKATLVSNFDKMQGSLGTSYNAFISATNLFLGSTVIGKYFQFVRVVEGTAVSFAAGALNDNLGGVINAVAGLAVAAAFVVWAPPTLPMAGLGLAASAVAGAAAQAFFETLQEFHPGIFEGWGDWFDDNFGGGGDWFDGTIGSGGLFGWGGVFASPFTGLFRDPLILDLDDDGIELSALAGSTVHFDYDQDGFAERTGWVSADDGILIADHNGNGNVDGAGELFGSPNQDGFAVLETFDSNGDGKIDAGDQVFGKLRVWRDLDQDGVADEGELQTLAEAGIAAIDLTRADVAGTNTGHGIGFEAGFTRADQTTGTAQTIYFETDRQDTRADNTPAFTPGEGVTSLPQLPGSGQINSIAWTATQDAAFRLRYASAF